MENSPRPSHEPPAAPAPPAAGQTLAQRFLLIRPLSLSLWLAEESPAARLRILRILLPAPHDDPPVLPAALADLALRLSPLLNFTHPHHAPLRALETLPDPDCAHGLLLATDPLGDITLASLLHHRAPGFADPQTLLHWTHQLCTALHAAHTHTDGIPHGDLRPRKIHFTPDRRLILRDHGLAPARLASGLPDPALHDPDAPFYRSPRRRLGHPPDIADDLYAVAAILLALHQGAPGPRTLASAPPADRPSVARIPMPDHWYPILATCLGGPAAHRPPTALDLLNLLLPDGPPELPAPESTLAPRTPVRAPAPAPRAFTGRIAPEVAAPAHAHPAVTPPPDEEPDPDPLPAPAPPRSGCAPRLSLLIALTIAALLTRAIIYYRQHPASHPPATPLPDYVGIDPNAPPDPADPALATVPPPAAPTPTPATVPAPTSPSPSAPDALRSLLAAAPGSPPPSPETTGILALDTAPSGLSVFFGSENLGLTPLRLPMPPGRYELTLRHPGWPEKPFGAIIRTQRETALRLDYQPGLLTLRTTPPGATVRSGGKLLGKTPLDLPGHPDGAPLDLRLELPGHQPRILLAPVPPETSKTLDITLDPIPIPAPEPISNPSNPSESASATPPGLIPARPR